MIKNSRTCILFYLRYCRNMKWKYTQKYYTQEGHIDCWEYYQITSKITAEYSPSCNLSNYIVLRPFVREKSVGRFVVLCAPVLYELKIDMNEVEKYLISRQDSTSWALLSIVLKRKLGCVLSNTLLSELTFHNVILEFKNLGKSLIG